MQLPAIDIEIVKVAEPHIVRLSGTGDQSTCCDAYYPLRALATIGALLAGVMSGFRYGARQLLRFQFWPLVAKIF